MKNYFKKLENKIKGQVKCESLIIVDNTNLHVGHKFFSSEKLHLHLKIKSIYLNSLPRLKAQRLLMSILKEDIKEKIHALEITIEK